MSTKKVSNAVAKVVKEYLQTLEKEADISVRGAYLRGFVDAVEGQPLDPPSSHLRAYLDGHHEGCLAFYRALDAAEQAAHEFTIACEKLID